MAAGRDHTSKVEGDAASLGRERSVVWLAIPVLAVLLVHGAAIFSPAPGFALEVDGGGSSLWPGLSFLRAMGDPAANSPAMRALLVFWIVVGAALTMRLVRLLNLDGFAPLLAGTLFAVSPFAGAALRDAAGVGYLLGLVCWLGMLCMEPREADGARSWPRTLTQVSLGLVSFWLSQGATLPCLFLLALLRVGRRKRLRTQSRILFAVLLVALCVPILFFKHALPAVGYGHSLHEGLSSFTDSHAAPGPPFLAALLASLGFGGEHPFLLPGRIVPEFSHLLGGLLVLGLLLGATFAPHHRRLAVRFGGLTIILASFGAVLVAMLSPASGLPTAMLLPSAVGFAILIASLVQGHRRLPTPPVAWPLAIAAMLALSVESYLLGSAPAETVFARAHVADPSSTYAAVRLSARRQLEDGAMHPEPIRRLILGASRQLLPLDLEKRLGLKVARDLEHGVSPAAALAWIDEWLARREGEADRDLYPEVRAQRIRLLIEVGDLDAALARLQEDQRTVGSLEYSWRTSRALLDALESGEMSHDQVAALVSVIEGLLANVDRSAGNAGEEALLTIAEVRLRQGRFTDAFRIAEYALERSPDSAHPRLLLARINLATGEREAGLRRVAEALQLDPEDPHARFVQGRLMTAGPASAERGLDLMLEAYQADPGVAGGAEELVAGLRAAGQALRTRGDLDRLDALLQRASSVLSQRLPILLERGLLERQRGRVEAACTALEAAHALDASNEEVRQVLAEILRDDGYRLLLAGQREPALTRFRRAVEVAPAGFAVEGMRAVLDGNDAALGDAPPQRIEQARIAYEEGMRRYTDGDLDGALVQLQESLQHLADNPYAHLSIGRIQLEQGDPEQAEASLRVALALGEEISADVEHGYLLLVRALLRQGRNEDAGQVAARYRERHPSGAYDEQIQALVSETD